MLKRLADWFEKMSAAFMVGAVITNAGMVAVFLGLVCLGLAMLVTKYGEQS
jgi:hypothetical protein